MQTGLLNRQTLNYHNPISNETLSLNKAHQKGFIIGHYTDSYVNEFNSHKTLSSSSTSHFHNQQYFIISVFDPSTEKSMSLDQAVHSGNCYKLIMLIIKQFNQICLLILRSFRSSQVSIRSSTDW